jgi:hypothetical protein
MVWYKRSCCSAPMKSCMLCCAGANGMRSDQWQKKQRSHFFEDLDWLSCGERWQSLHLLTSHIRSCMLCPAGAKGMRSDQWQQKTEATLFSRLGLVVLWWTMAKSSSAYMMCKNVCSTLLFPTTWEVTNDNQFQFAHTFSQDLDWWS